MDAELYRSAVMVEGLGVVLLIVGLTLADGVPAQPALVCIGSILVVVFSTFLMTWECFFARQPH